MVTIKRSHTVIPTEPTPKGPFWLSESDQLSPRTLAPLIYIYKTNHNLNSHNQCRVDCVDRLRDSLGKILVHYYPLAGRLRWIGGGRLELDCNEMGATLSEAESSRTLDEYGDFASNSSITELIPKIDYSKPIEELPLLLVQLTRFNCGALSIGVAISHTIVDGTAAIHFINSWAKLARGETLQKEEMPFFDRTVLRSPAKPLTAQCFDHPVKSLPLILGSSDDVDERKKETCVALLKLTRDQVGKLKNKANEEIMVSSLHATRPYSRYEAVAAHIWRSATKARKNDEHQPTTVRLVGDFRNRLKPSLPQNYFGNALLPTVTPICHSGDIISNPLSYAAKKMRETVDKTTDEYLRSELDFLASQENVDWLRANFHWLGCLKSQFLGNPNLNIVSWLSMPVYEADFGWGKPMYMGPGVLNADGKSFIVPSPSGDGSVVVHIRLQTAHMEDFQKFFFSNLCFPAPRLYSMYVLFIYVSNVTE